MAGWLWESSQSSWSFVTEPGTYRSMMDIRGATRPAAQDALAMSAAHLKARFFVFHLLSTVDTASLLSS